MPQHNQPILVTGGSGYLASWVVKYLLAEGYYVRATVRNKQQPEKVEHLMQAAMDEPGVLELVEADLLQEGSFTEGMQGCKWVIHMASPFMLGRSKNPQEELIDPALKGTRNVLHSVNATPSVERVVLTSSVAAVAGDYIEIRQTANNIFTEEHWNQSSSLTHQPYPYAKTLAEKEAWEIAKAQDRWDLVVTNPGFVLGPSLSKRKDGASIDFVLGALKGNFRTGAAKMTMALVDVRDVARAHILACASPKASGRHLLISDHVSMLNLTKMLGTYAPSYKSKLPKSEAPKALMYLAGPLLGFSWRYIRDNVGIPIQYDTSYSKEDLGLSYRPLEDTLKDMVLRMQELGQI